MSFRVQQAVRFAHVDAAGIVFYPRYFEMMNAVVEDYFAQIVGVSFAAMHVDRRLGVPTVKLDVEFRAPSRLGDLLDFRLAVTRVGRSSADLSIDVDRGGEARLSARLVIVCIRLDTGLAIAWPEDMRPMEAPAIEAGSGDR